MTKEEIMKRLERIEYLLFDLEMADRWTPQERIDYDRLRCEKRDLENKLKNM